MGNEGDWLIHVVTTEEHGASWVWRHEAVGAYCDGYDVGYELYWYDDWLGTEVMFEHA